MVKETEPQLFKYTYGKTWILTALVDYFTDKMPSALPLDSTGAQRQTLVTDNNARNNFNQIISKKITATENYVGLTISTNWKKAILTFAPYQTLPTHQRTMREEVHVHVVHRRSLHSTHTVYNKFSTH